MQVKVSVFFALVLVLASTATAEFRTREAVSIPKVDRAPELRDFIGNTQPQTALAKVERFLQRTPQDGAPATQQTDVFLGYDSTNLYVIFRCFDAEPDKIRGRLTNRDQIAVDDDAISVMLDTFGDHQRAYTFFVNPIGVQNDAMWTEGQDWDLSYDTVWSSKAEVTPFGYAVSITIPFRSLRFPPAASQKWNITLTRDIPRLSEMSCWPSCSNSVEGWLSQSADLIGPKNIRSGRNIQIVPYVFERSSRSLDDRDAAHPRFANQTFEPTVGFDTKFVLRDSMVLDLTVNPDFSQVESDEPQTTVNQRFENFFPEKRPFFLENADYFRTPIKLVFTRRLADPQFGARLTGKTGPWALGLLFADDQAPGKTVPPGDPLSGKRGYVGIGRLSRTIFNQSNIGFLYTGRRFEDRVNHAGGFDTRIKFNDQWVATGQAVATFTDLMDGTRLSGPGYYASIARIGRRLTQQLEYRDISPELRADAGYIYRGNVRRIDETFDYRWWPQGRLNSWGPHIWAASI